MRKVMQFWKDERGQDLVEYALAAGLVAVAAVACMPGLSGAELQGELIAQGVNTPIIFVTAFPEDSLRRRVLDAGAVGFLSKPFDEERLISCLETALGTS